MEPNSMEKIGINRNIIQKSVIHTPHSEEIPTPLVAGRAINIIGTVKPKATRLAINLNCGQGAGANIALHVNPRFDQNYVVRNCLLDRHWGEEEIVAFRKNPFKREETFYLCILFTEDNFLVSVNGEHFCAFRYRVSLKEVNTLEIVGDVIVTSIKHRHIDEYPEPSPLNPVIEITSLGFGIDPIKIPFFGKLQKSLNVGNTLEISGRVKLLPSSFYINLQSGQTLWPHPEIPLHINPRFVPLGGSNLVCNSWLYNKWGQETSAMLTYFRPGRNFSLKIICEKDEYVIQGDNIVLTRFKHRVTPELSTVLHIQGDVEIYHVKEIWQ